MRTTTKTSTTTKVAVGVIGTLAFAAALAVPIAMQNGSRVTSLEKNAVNKNVRNGIVPTPAPSPVKQAPSPTNPQPLCQRLLVPSYFSAENWSSMSSTVSGFGGIAILNPDSGPSTAKDPGNAAVAVAAKQAGMKVIGYVHTYDNYGEPTQSLRSVKDVKREITLYKTWYAVDGIFLDEGSNGVAALPFYREVVKFIRSTPGTFVVLNPGTVPERQYMDLGDLIVTFESPFAEYASYSAPAWLAKSYPSSKIAHLVYDVPTGEMENILKKAASFNAGNVYVTDRSGDNPWENLPTYFSKEVDALRASCSPQPVPTKK